MLQIANVLKHCKGRKYYVQDCWKILFCSLHFQQWFKFLEKTLIWMKGISTVKNLPISKISIFLKSNFDLKQMCKKRLRKTIKFGFLMHLSCFIVSIKIRSELWMYRKFQIIEVWITLGQIIKRYLFAQTIQDKIFETKWKTSVKVGWTMKLWYIPLGTFERLSATFSFCKGLGI